MSVYLLRPYGGFAASSTIQRTFPDSTETSLIAQGLATAAGTTSMPSVFGGPDQQVTQGGNIQSATQGGYGAITTQAPSFLPNVQLNAAALTTYETNGVAQTVGTFNFAEIFVPGWNTWTGAGMLNGTGVGTDLVILALWGANGALLANTAVAGTLNATASVFQNIAFTSPITLAPGRYFVGVQINGTTVTPRHILAAYCPNATGIITGSVAGTFGTVPATITVPTTFTSAAGPIMQLYV